MLGRKQRIALVLVALMVFALFVTVTRWPDQNLHLIFCDVGQGDAVLITYQFEQLLIDGGPESSRALDCLQQHIPWWDKNLELLIATHPDADHIGGLDVILQAYDVSRTVWNGEMKDTAVFDRFYRSLQKEKNKGGVVELVDSNNSLHLSAPVTLAVLSPREQVTISAGRNTPSSETTLQDTIQPMTAVKSDTNTRSIAIKLTYHNVVTLLMADVSQEVEKSLCTSSLLGDATILKVAHHGSKSSTSECFLERTTPEISILSVGKKNKYGHPSPEVIKKLVSSGSQIIRTDEVGTIELVTNGQRVWWRQ